MVGSEAYPRRDCWRNVWRGRVNAELRAEVLKAEVKGVDLDAARAKVRAVAAIMKLLIDIKTQKKETDQTRMIKWLVQALKRNFDLFARRKKKVNVIRKN